MLSIKDVAEITGIPEWSVRNRVLSRELRAYKLCNRYRIKQEDLEEWARNRTV